MSGKMRTTYLGILSLLAVIPCYCSGELDVKVSPYPARVYRGAPPGVTVATVMATNNQTGRVTTLSLEETEDAGFFQINPNGVISTLERIKRRVGSSFKFKVNAHQRGKDCGKRGPCADQATASRKVVVIVSKKNHHAPRFDQPSYGFPVHRTRSVGSRIAKLTATDDDREPYNKHISFYAPLKQYAAQFAKVSPKGDLTLTKPIPDNVTMLDLITLVVDNGSPQLTGTTTITLSAMDIVRAVNPTVFCITYTKSTLRLCWQNPMPEDAIERYSVQVVDPNNRFRQDFVHVKSQHKEACYSVNNTKKGEQYVLTVTVDSAHKVLKNDDADRINMKNFGTEGHNGDCMKYSFSSCSFTFPCKAHGRCVQKPGGSNQEHLCECDDGWEGKKCEIRNMCKGKNPCQNGRCVNINNKDYECQCDKGFVGKQCEISDPCIHSPCENQGRCEPRDDGTYHCYCRSGFHGKICQNGDRVQSCRDIECWNGTCYMGDDSHPRCNCSDGFYGELCDSYDVCRLSVPMCSLKGTCESSYSESDTKQDPSGKTKTGFTCKCEDHFYGEACQLFDECSTNPCKNGKCTRNDGDGYSCQCRDGYHGINCSEHVPCFTNPCLNGGTCSRSARFDRGFRCDCPDEFLGTRCQHHTINCTMDDALNLCQNQGRCAMREVNPNLPVKFLRAECICRDGYSGRHCQLKRPCYPSPCVAGKCVEDLPNFRQDLSEVSYERNLSKYFHCECFDGATGPRCNIPDTTPRDKCKTVTCHNGATCVHGLCVCTPTFTGTACLDEIPECMENETLLNSSCQCDNGKIVCTPKPSVCGKDDYELRRSDGSIFCTKLPPGDFRQDMVFTCCGSPPVCRVYDPDCSSRTHCSEMGVPDTTCHYYVTVCNGRGLCTDLRQLHYSCNDLVVPEDNGWVHCAEGKLNVLSSADPHGLDVDQVALYGKIVEDLRQAALLNKSLAQLAMDSISTLASVNSSVKQEVETNNKTYTRLRGFIDDYTAKVSLEQGAMEVSTEEFCVQAKSLSKFEPRTEFDIIGGIQTSMSIYLPMNILAEMNARRIQFVGYRKSQLFVSPNFPTDAGVVDKQAVISATVTNHTLRNLTEPVTISLPTIKDGENHTCVFWDMDESQWSTKGVITSYDADKGQVICKSNHLTSFAVLLTPTPEAVHSEQALTYITYIGCAVSMAGLLFTLVTYGLFRCLHGEKSGKILLNLCLALLFMNAVFLAGTVDVSSYDRLSCTIVAMLLHYLVLASLTWMLLEAVEMYQAIITVFAKYERLYLVKRTIIGWGVPALIVGATAGVDINMYGTKRIRGDGEIVQICFLSGGSKIAYYVSLLTPACIIIAINTVVFILVTRVILKQRLQQQMTGGSPFITPAQVRGAMTVMFLLGVTWVFGPLAIGEATVVFSYLFCICNSLQGLLIFVFRCLFNPEARLAWTQLVKTGTLKRRRGPIKSAYTDSSTSKAGNDTVATNRRLSNSTSAHLSTTYQTASTSASSSASTSKTPLYNKPSGSHLHPHQLHNTNGWHPNLNGWRRDNGHVINNPLHAGFDHQPPGSDDQVVCQSESRMAKRDLLPPDSQGDYTDELTHL